MPSSHADVGSTIHLVITLAAAAVDVYCDALQKRKEIDGNVW